MMAAAPEIRIARYPAARGFGWLREALAMVVAARGPWVRLMLLYYLVMLAVEILPFIGGLLVPVLKPVFAVGFLAAAWAQERGERPTARLLFQGFRANLVVLLTLGVLFRIGLEVAGRATMLFDNGQLFDVLAQRTPIEDEGATVGALQRGMFFAALCTLPVLLALWYAPGLVVFHGCGPLRAIRLSLQACAANWRPMLVYGLVVLGYGVMLPSLVVTVLAIGMSLVDALRVGLVLLMPYFLFLLATLHASDYVCYRDVFHADEKADSAAPAAPPTGTAGG